MQLEATEPLAAQHNMEVKKLSNAQKTALGEKVVKARNQVDKASLALLKAEESERECTMQWNDIEWRIRSTKPCPEARLSSILLCIGIS